MKNYKKYFIIPASPEEVYQALTNPLTIEMWSGEEATMSTEPGSEFALWSDSIVGKNIEFIENKKMVQQWYFNQIDESIVTIKLHADGSGTSVELHHTNIPDDDYENITEGWREAYMGSLQEYFSDRN
jgi:activator of HSP90 ATPase